MSERARVRTFVTLIVVAAWVVLGGTVLQAVASMTLANDVRGGLAVFFGGVGNGAYWFAIVMAIACSLLLAQAIGLRGRGPEEEPDEGGRRGKRGRRRPARG